MSWLFASGGQSTGVSALATDLPMNIQGSFPLGLTGLISLLSEGLLRVLQHHNLYVDIPNVFLVTLPMPSLFVYILNPTISMFQSLPL